MGNGKHGSRDCTWRLSLIDTINSLTIPDVLDSELVSSWSVHGAISSVGMVVRPARNSNTGQWVTRRDSSSSSQCIPSRYCCIGNRSCRCSSSVVAVGEEAGTSNDRLRIPEGLGEWSCEISDDLVDSREVASLSALNREGHWERYQRCTFSALFPWQQAHQAGPADGWHLMVDLSTMVSCLNKDGVAIDSVQEPRIQLGQGVGSKALLSSLPVL